MKKQAKGIHKTHLKLSFHELKHMQLMELNPKDTMNVRGGGHHTLAHTLEVLALSCIGLTFTVLFFRRCQQWLLTTVKNRVAHAKNKIIAFNQPLQALNQEVAPLNERLQELYRKDPAPWHKHPTFRVFKEKSTVVAQLENRLIAREHLISSVQEQLNIDESEKMDVAEALDKMVEESLKPIKLSFNEKEYTIDPLLKKDIYAVVAENSLTKQLEYSINVKKENLKKTKALLSSLDQNERDLIDAPGDAFSKHARSNIDSTNVESENTNGQLFSVEKKSSGKKIQFFADDAFAVNMNAKELHSDELATDKEKLDKKKILEQIKEQELAINHSIKKYHICLERREKVKATLGITEHKDLLDMVKAMGHKVSIAGKDMIIDHFLAQDIESIIHRAPLIQKFQLQLDTGKAPGGALEAVNDFGALCGRVRNALGLTAKEMQEQLPYIANAIARKVSIGRKEYRISNSLYDIICQDTACNAIPTQAEWFNAMDELDVADSAYQTCKSLYETNDRNEINELKANLHEKSNTRLELEKRIQEADCELTKAEGFLKLINVRQTCLKR